MALDTSFGQLKPTLQVSQNFALKKSMTPAIWHEDNDHHGHC